MRAKLGAGVFDSLRPISLFFGGMGICEKTGVDTRPTLKDAAAIHRLMRDLKVIGDI
jgi:hypothetical protein